MRLGRIAKYSHRIVPSRSLSVCANGKQYKVPEPNRPVVGICLDGSSQDYIDAAVEAGQMPCWIEISNRFKNHNKALGTAQMPALTVPNNVGMMTGEAAKFHGIAGNSYFDEERKVEVVMDDEKYLRCDSIFSKLNEAGTHVTVLTVKDKLIRLLGTGLNPATSMTLSLEGANSANLLPAPRPLPEIDDPDASIYLLELGLHAMQQRQKDPALADTPAVYHLSTSDALQHQYPPGSSEANAFYHKFDALLGNFDQAGALVGVTADHGMNDKSRYDGSPRVMFAGSVLREHGIACHILLPIAGGRQMLGSYATVHLENKDQLVAALAVLREEPGVYQAIGRDDACLALQLPEDRVGDIVLLGDAHSVIGRTPEDHDLEGVRGLRSHGGLEEQVVPMFFNRELLPAHKKQLGRGKARNYHLYDMLLNGVVAS